MGYDLRSELPPEGQELFDTLPKSAKNLFALGGHHIFDNMEDMGVAAGYAGGIEGDEEVLRKILMLRQFYLKETARRLALYEQESPLWKVAGWIVLIAVLSWLIWG